MTLVATSVCVSLRNILLPTDFSPYSATALAYGAGLARRYDSTLYTVTVVPEEITDYVRPPDPFYLRHSAEKKMRELAGQQLLQGVKHRGFVKEGFIAQTLLELIHRLEIDLLVLGTHGRGGMKKLVLGSVAEEMMSGSPCPVFTVGPRVSPATAPQARLENILYVTNLLQGPGKALRYAAWLAEQERARLTLLHVLRTPGNVPCADAQAQKEAARQRLAELLPPEIGASTKTGFMVETGVPGERIVKAAETLGANLIVMGAHRTAYARVSTHLPWITPHHVLCHARCPVLTVRD